MRVRLFLLLILFLCVTSFFWEDEEKQLRELHHSGESAFQKRDFEGAKKAFEDLFGRINVGTQQKYQVDWNTYVDIAIRLTLCYEELAQKNEAATLLEDLLSKNLPTPLIPQVKLIRARIKAAQGAPECAYIEMRQIVSCYPMEQWPGRERVFFQALEDSLDDHYDMLILRAKRYLTVGFYSDAAALYEKIVKAINQECYPKVKSDTSLIEKTIRYRLAECYYLNRNYEQSLAICTDIEHMGDSRLDREMVYLSALCYHKKKEYEKALELFKSYVSSSDCTLDHYDQALFEIGNSYYQKGNFEKARCYFETLVALGPLQGPSQIAALLLAQIHLQENNPKEVEPILAPVAIHLNPSDLLFHEYFYLRGLAAYSLGAFAEAKEMFAQSIPSKSPCGWRRDSLYHLGWCDLKLGDQTTDSLRISFFDHAETLFTQLLQESYDEASCLALGQLYLLRFRHCADHTALEKLSQLLENPLESWEGRFSMEGQVEALLLKAASSENYEQKEQLLHHACADLFAKSALHSQEKYSVEALYVLATFYYERENYEQAQKFFLQLAKEHPTSHRAAEGWFWAAESTERLGKDPKPFRARVYIDYPECEWAAKAYFHYYPYHQYLEGKSEALDHLKELSARFPDSYLLIPAYYLIGMNEHNLSDAKTSFDKALLAFSNYIKDHPTPEMTMIYLRYQAMLQLATRYLESTESPQHLEECEKILTVLIDEWNQKDHPFASLLKSNDPYPPIFEEGEFRLVQCYLKQKRDLKAQKILAQMIVHYTVARKDEGSYYAQVWEQQGRLAMGCSDFDTALTCFNTALDKKGEPLSDEQRLTLWILQSEAFRGKKEYGTAMRLLSRVINTEFASPLRLKAMLLRAEIYEAQGRPELAIRQLESVAKKGGEWALEAKIKLNTLLAEKKG